MTHIQYKRPQLDVEYDGVAIVDGLLAADRTEWQVSERLEQILRTASINSFIAQCGNRPGLLAAFKTIRSRAEAGEMYCVHLVAHGNEKGIGIGGTDFLPWRDFGAALEPLNRALHGQLIVNMTACKGIHGIKGVDLRSGHDPFFGIVGVKHNLKFIEALTLNDCVYRLWFVGTAINQIVRSVNNGARREILYCVSAEGFRQLAGT